MSRDPSTIVTLLTPAGRGAIASLAVEGPRAWEIVLRLFHPASKGAERNCGASQEPAADRILFGRWGSSAGEEIVIRCRSRASVEIHCHGGQAAPAAIVDSLKRDGCRLIDWPAACQRINDDEIATQARIALAAARTERAARILLAQFNGALGRALDDIRGRIAAADVSGAVASVQALLARANLGRHLEQPWRVVLAGRPNVGKSSLINALVGYSRSIVFDMPGTTRDVVTAITALDGWPVELSDTAGLRSGGDALEIAGVRLAEEQLGRADLVVLVFDATAPWSADDVGLVKSHSGGLLVYNKCDLLDEVARKGLSENPAAHSPHPRPLSRKGRGEKLAAAERPVGILTSALTRQGLPALEKQIARRLVPQPPDPGDAVPFSEEQITLLARLLASLERAELATAGEILRRAPSAESPRHLSGFA